VRPVAERDYDTSNTGAGTYLKISVLSILSDVKPQTGPQRVQQKTVVFNQQASDYNRVVPGKRQKKNRQNGDFTPLMVLVLLHPQRVSQHYSRKWTAIHTTAWPLTGTSSEE
jgi:hypothetical protein